MQFRFDKDDRIVPVRILHNSEQIWNGDELEQNYNYLVYEFETEQHFYTARSYLDDIREVFIFGPFEKSVPTVKELRDVPLDQRVLAYLRRRYFVIKQLGSEGYV